MEDKPHHQWETVRHRSETEKVPLSQILEEEGMSGALDVVEITRYGYVPNYPKPIDTNPFNLIEGNENKLY